MLIKDLVAQRKSKEERSCRVLARDLVFHSFDNAVYMLPPGAACLCSGPFIASVSQDVVSSEERVSLRSTV